MLKGREEKDTNTYQSFLGSGLEGEAPEVE